MSRCVLKDNELPCHDSSRGFTLIELAIVVLLLALVAGVAATRVESLAVWRLRGDLRRFVNTWELLYREALNRGEAYRLVIDLDSHSYAALREVQVQDGAVVRQVDYLKNLRLESERRRRASKAQEAAVSLEEEYRAEDYRQNAPLEELFYQYVFNDPAGNMQLKPPLEFPSLAEPRRFASGLRFLDVRVQGDVHESGEAIVRFSPRGGSDFAVVHLQVQDEIFTAIMNPSSGEVGVRKGYIDYEWSVNRGRERS